MWFFELLFLLIKQDTENQLLFVCMKNFAMFARVLLLQIFLITNKSFLYGYIITIFV